MNRNVEIDQTTLDRLADGELNSEEQRRLLELLEGNPDQWKRCALTFIELQSIESQMSNIFGESPDVRPSAQVFTADRRRNGISLPWLLATAACICVAFGLGQRMTSSDPTGGMVATPMDGFAGTPQLVPVNGGQPPLAGDWWLGRSVVPPDMERKMENLGLKVQRSRGLYRQHAPDGSPVFYPYEDVKLIPARNVIQ